MSDHPPEQEPKIFRLKADFTFGAYDLDDAWLQLAYHFLTLERGYNTDLIEGGGVELAPVDGS